MWHSLLARLAATGVLALMLAQSAAAQERADPDWPCIQRKVPTLSMGQMWPSPVPEVEPENAGEIAALARRISPRRVSAEDAAAIAAEFIDGLEDEERASQLAHLFSEVVDRINAERGQVISGIGRYARRQAALAEAIEIKQFELARLESQPEEQRDAEKIEVLRSTLAWDTRIFRERQQSLAYVCETPTLLERRAFELGRALSDLR